MNRIPYPSHTMPILKPWDRAMREAQKRTQETRNAAPTWIDRNRTTGAQPVRA